MNLLSELLAYATGDAAADPQRVQALLVKLRDLLAEHGDTDLAALEAQAAEQFWGLYNDGEYNPADADTMKALADVRDAVLELQSERDREKAARDQEVAELADRVRTVPVPAETPEQPGHPEDHRTPTGPSGGPAPEGQLGDDTGDAPADDPGDPATPPTTPESAAPASGAGTEPPAAPPAPAPPAPPAIAAAPAAPPPARRQPTAAALQQHRPAPPAPPAEKPLRSFVITASAEIPDHPMGQHLTVEQLAEASAARFATLPVGQPANAPIKANVARIHRRFDPSITLTGNQTDVDVIDQVADERRLPGGSLAAAVHGKITNLTAAVHAPSVIQDVWCTPSQTDYTLCEPLATRDGLLDLPTTGMPARGGIRYPVWTQYPEQEADADRNHWRGYVEQYPEIENPPAPAPTTGLADPNYFRKADPNAKPPIAETGAGYPKKCISGPCVDWREVRQSLSYLCIESNVLQDRTFPEGIARFTSDVLVHHAHFLNETYINHIVARADPIPAFNVSTGPGSLGSVSLTLVDRLSLLITWFRNKYKMSRSATLEIVLPEWFREYIKLDIEKKNNRPFGSVSDAEVAALFVSLASRVQWIRDWQELPNGAPVGGRIMPPEGWPEAVNMLAYPAGSWVLSEGNILQFGVQYDYTLLKEQRYAAMFTEDAWMLVNRCNRTFLVQLTGLCANGATGPFRDACPPAVPGSSETTLLYTREVPAALAASGTESGTGDAGTSESGGGVVGVVTGESGGDGTGGETGSQAGRTSTSGSTSGSSRGKK